jgi:hypothetical protein
MTKTLAEIRDDLLALDLPRPFGIEIRIDDDADSLIIANGELGFAITGNSKEFAKEHYCGTLPRLVEILSDPALKAQCLGIMPMKEVDGAR